MSGQLRGLGRLETERMVDRCDGVGTVAHPRAMGFRVLSRMARAEAETSYVPRHRLDAPVDSAAATSFAR
jgi:hypothetical protein